MKLLGNIRPVAALDLHDPFMWGWANDHTCITYPRGGGAELDRFSQCLQKATAVSSIRHDPQYDLKWGAEWNCAEEGLDVSANNYYDRLDCKIAPSIEVPYFGTEKPSCEDFVRFGRELFVAIGDYFDLSKELTIEKSSKKEKEL